MEILGLVDIPLWLLLVIAVLATLYVYFTWNFGIFKELGIPGPRPWPVFGSMFPLFTKGFVENELSLLKKYGKLFGMYEGRTPALVIRDQEMIRQIFVKESNIFTNRRNINVEVEPMSLMITILEDDHWKRVRNLMTPAFSAGKLKKMNWQVNECAKYLKKNLAEQADAGKAVDMKEYAGAFTMDVIASTGFGLQIDSQKDIHNPFVTLAKKAFAFSLFNPAFIIAFFLPFLIPLVQKLNVSFFPKDVTAFFLDIVNRTIDQRMDGEEKRVDFLQLMLNAHKDLEGYIEAKKEVGAEDGEVSLSDVDIKKGLTRNEILAQSVIFLLAGYETTASAISFLMYNMALYPECQEKLYNEIMANIGDQDIVDYNILSQMPYLDMCLNETLRIYPPLVRVDRMTKCDINIEGVQIKKDMVMILPIYMLHHDPDIWPEPEKFDPERFTAEAKAQRSPYHFVPFGLGARNCIGMRLALIELKLAIIHAVRAFKFMTCEETQIPLKFKKGGLLQVENGVMLKVQHRA